jgi:hypothetical protein
MVQAQWRRQAGRVGLCGAARKAFTTSMPQAVFSPGVWPAPLIKTPIPRESVAPAWRVRSGSVTGSNSPASSKVGVEDVTGWL